MALIVRCDRCGGVRQECSEEVSVKSIAEPDIIQLKKTEIGIIYNRLDFCHACKAEFDKWLEEKRERPFKRG